MCQGWGLSPFTVALDANLTEGVNMLYVSSEQPIGQNARFVGAYPLYSWHFANYTKLGILLSWRYVMENIVCVL